MRTVTWLLYYAFSIFSLLCGFYDLYKNFPVVQVRATFETNDQRGALGLGR